MILRVIVLLNCLVCVIFSSFGQAVNYNSFKSDIAFLASDEMGGRMTGTIYQDIAAQYIASRFQQSGLSGKGDKNTYFQSFYYKNTSNDPHMNIPGATSPNDSMKITNVVGFIDNKASKTIIIGAHYDHLGHGGNGFSLSPEKDIHNGADDNASGVAIMLKLSEILAKSPSKYNYLFIAFSGEELGLWGSNYFVKNPTIDLKSSAAMINLDMVGRLKEDKSILVGGVGTSPIWKDHLNKTNVSKLNMSFQEAGSGPSDHTSFYFKDIPVLFFFTGQHADYHKPSDDIDKINFDGMQAITENIFTLLKSLEDVPSITFTKTDDAQKEQKVEMKVTLGVMPDYMYNEGGLRIDGVKEGKPAHSAGLKAGDIILKIHTFDVSDIYAYMEALNKINPGQKVGITYKRDGKVVEGSIQF